jgi:predicted dehydrogenase
VGDHACFFIVKIMKCLSTTRENMQNQPTQPLRAAVIGLAWPGQRHLEAYQQVPGVEIVAVADVNEKTLSIIGDQFNVPHRYTDYTEMVRRDDLDIVSVCTPNFLHPPMAIAALEAGKHVLCEKPIARAAADGETMVQAAKASGRALEIVFNRRHRGDMKALKSAIDEGMLGRIYHAKVSWMRRNGIPGMGGWFTNRDMSGGGPLIDLGIHLIDMALFLMGEPEVASVSAATYAELGPRGRGSRGDHHRAPVGSEFNVEDLATAFIRMTNNTTLTLETSWATYRPEDDEIAVNLFGTDGGAEIKIVNYQHGNTLRLFVDVAGVPADIHPHLEPVTDHVGVVADFVETIRSGNWSHLTGENGLQRTRIIDACYQSARERREIALNSVTR